MSLWRPNKNGVQHCPRVIPALGEQSQKDPGAPCLVSELQVQGEKPISKNKEEK